MKELASSYMVTLTRREELLSVTVWARAQTAQFADDKFKMKVGG